MTYWLFQANPQRFDLVGAAGQGGPGVYAMNQNRDKVATGDRVLFFLSGPSAGIYALGEITGMPYLADQPDEFGRWKVPIEYLSLVEPPLLRAEILVDPVLGAWRPFHGLERTNFVMPEQIAARCDLVVERRTDRARIVATLDAESKSSLRDGRSFAVAADLVRKLPVDDEWLQDLVEIGHSIDHRWNFLRVPLEGGSPEGVLRAMHRSGLDEERATAQSALVAALESDGRAPGGDPDEVWWMRFRGIEAAERFLDRVEGDGDSPADQDLVDLVGWITDTKKESIETIAQTFDVLRNDLERAAAAKSPAIPVRAVQGAGSSKAATPESTAAKAEPEMNRLVDAFAVSVAVRELHHMHPGRQVEVMAHNNPGYDIEVRDGDLVLRYVEVKGTTQSAPVFFISEGERRFSLEHGSSYSILVVHSIDLASARHQLAWHDGPVETAYELTPVQWAGRARAATVGAPTSQVDASKDG